MDPIKRPAGRIVFIGIIFFLFVTVLVGSVYLYKTHSTRLSRKYHPKDKSLPHLKTLPFEAYTLLPKFQNKNYESRFMAGGQMYPPMNKPGIRWDSATKSAAPIHQISIFQGMEIEYTIYDIATQAIILKVDYTISHDDMEKAKIIYLCDGNIIGDQNLIADFTYKFSKDWDLNSCKAAYIALGWSTPPLIGNIYPTDDQIKCTDTPSSPTSLFTYNSADETLRSMGWKGAWVGMRWYAHFGVGSSDVKELQITDPTKSVLVVSPKQLVMSTS